MNPALFLISCGSVSQLPDKLLVRKIKMPRLKPPFPSKSEEMNSKAQQLPTGETLSLCTHYTLHRPFSRVKRDKYVLPSPSGLS